MKKYTIFCFCLQLVLRERGCWCSVLLVFSCSFRMLGACMAHWSLFVTYPVSTKHWNRNAWRISVGPDRLVKERHKRSPSLWTQSSLHTSSTISDQQTAQFLYQHLFTIFDCCSSLYASCTSIYDPAGICRRNDVVLTSMRRHHVASTSIRLHFNVVCLLGSVYQASALHTGASIEPLHFTYECLWSKAWSLFGVNMSKYDLFFAISEPFLYAACLPASSVPQGR